MLTLNREERDKLREDAMRELDFDTIPRGYQEDYGAAWGRRVARYLAILEQIGWEPEGDRESYELDMDPEVVQEVLSGCLDYARSVYADDSREMFRFAEGPIPKEWKSEGESDEETRAGHRQRVDRAAHELAVVDRMFMRAVEARQEAGVA